MSQYVLSSTNIPDLEEVVRMTVASQAPANMNYLQTSFSTASRTAVMQSSPFQCIVGRRSNN